MTHDHKFKNPEIAHTYSRLFLAEEEEYLASLASQIKPLLQIRGGRGPTKYTDQQLCLWASYLGIVDSRGESPAEAASRLGSTTETIRRQRRRVEGRRIRTDWVPTSTHGLDQSIPWR